MDEVGFRAGRAGRFATTRWSLVLTAGQKASARSTDALTSLCEMYWYPVYAFIRRQGCRAEEAGDLTQEFFTRLLEKGYLHDADPARGRFRTFLCTSVRHFLSNERDRARALKRGGGQPSISFDAETAEGHYQLEPRDDLTPEKLFDRRWAMLLLERALVRLQEEHVLAGKADLFRHLKGFLSAGSGPYRDAADALGMTEGAVKVAVHRLRRRFRDALVEQIAETVANPSEIDAEIAFLLKAVSL